MKTRNLVLVAGLSAAIGLTLWLTRAPRTRTKDAAAEPGSFVGSAACAPCHSAAYASWSGSQHSKAMATAVDSTVLGDFDGARFTYAGIRSSFFRRNDRFFVETDGPDGNPAAFEILYTFGLKPLQQYLVALPGGRLQALGVAWDSRPAEAGGRRWFHLYPDQELRAGNPLHWTGHLQTWNHMCADCHSTNLRKNYDAQTDTYATSWSEISVGCEACHGPASAHVAWAQRPPTDREPGMGLLVPPGGDHDVVWVPDPATGNAVRSRPRTSDREIEICARCHGRRGQLTDSVTAADPFLDGFRASVLTPGLYHPDGQMRDEVFNYASFLQSRMYTAGVTCSDCHEPHAGTLRAPREQVCLQCHAAPRYETPAHHFHEPGTPGADCVTCHMPATTYMIVDPRHDHSFRVPRPEMTARIGAPDPCITCHTDRSPAWAEGEIRKRRTVPPRSRPEFAETFAAFDDGLTHPGALINVIEDARLPAIVRASGLERLAQGPAAATPSVFGRAARDPNPLVRAAAARALRRADPALRLEFLAPLLEDSLRCVRIDAAASLADLPDGQLAAVRPAFDRAFAEHLETERFGADTPEGLTNLGTTLAGRGDLQGALDPLQRAVRKDPTWIPAAVNLADLHRARGEEAEAERVLRAAATVNPESGSLRHALGLCLVRRGQREQGLVELRAAVRLEPEAPRHVYVLAVALHDLGNPAEAIRLLETARARHPHDADIRDALTAYRAETGGG